MNPRTHPRGARPDFTLPKPNPNPSRMTDALWWLVCMREALEPTLSENGGTLALKPGYHSYGSRLPDYGLGNIKTDHSIRRAPDRTGKWWKDFTSAHDWTFLDAQKGDYKTIQKYTKRLIAAMRDPNDLRPDDVFAYTLGQTDGDPIVEGYNEYRDDDETSADKTHLWHRHDSYRRNIIGDFWAMWKALTIDMGWTYDDWLRSVTPAAKDDFMSFITNRAQFQAEMTAWAKTPEGSQALLTGLVSAKYGSQVYPNRTLLNFLLDLHGARDFLTGGETEADPKYSKVTPDKRLAQMADVPSNVDQLKTDMAEIKTMLAALTTPPA